jgi:hypothetical protein
MKCKTRNQIETEYDALYEKVNALISETNPCEVTIAGKTAYCMACSHRVCGDVIKPNELCCDGCKHHDISKGCQADKPLACKLWLCSHSKKKHAKIADRLYKFEQEARELFGCFFFSRGDKTEQINRILAVQSMKNADA